MPLTPLGARYCCSVGNGRQKHGDSQAQVKGEICRSAKCSSVASTHASADGRSALKKPSVPRAPPETITIQRCPCPRSPSALKTTEHPRSANHPISSTTSTTAPSQARRGRTVAHQIGTRITGQQRSPRATQTLLSSLHMEPFPQVSASIALKRSVIPKLRARVRFSSPAPCKSPRPATGGFFVVWSASGVRHHLRTASPRVTSFGARGVPSAGRRRRVGQPSRDGRRHQRG